ncbi:MAG TPA: thioredoxin domain-containing protein [Bdellovibrionota bacterium]|nr:thioredoxin domain-containing protein [Bdellovibrionota bacterium]
MRAPKRLIVVILAALVGMVLMLMQARQFFLLHAGLADFSSYCTFGSFDCHAVESSAYAEFLPGLPLAAFAAAFFAGLAIIALFARNAFWRREAVRMGFTYTGLGMLFSWTYLAIMLTRLTGLCLFCLTVDTIIALSFVIFLTLKPERPGKGPQAIDKAKWKTMGLSVIAAIVVMIVGAKVILDTAPALPSDRADQEVQNVVATAVTPVPLPSDLPGFGPPDAAVTMVKFADFECPACKMGAMAIHPLTARFPKDLRIIYRHFPLDPSCNRKVEHPMHPVSCLAARVAYCASQRGKFKEVYESFFEHQDDLPSVGPVPMAAKASGIPAAELEKCAASPEAQSAIARDVEDGIALGVEATPTYFINGRKVPGGLPTELWIRVIQALLKK